MKFWAHSLPWQTVDEVRGSGEVHTETSLKNTARSTRDPRPRKWQTRTKTTLSCPPLSVTY